MIAIIVYNMSDEQVTKKWLSEEIKFFIQIGTVLATVILGWAALHTEIALTKQRLDIIEGNHLVHIQTSMQSLVDSQKIEDDKIVEMDKKIERILTILGK